MKSDAVYKKTKRQIQKEYNDALERALKKNREYFKTVEAVQSGKIKPPSGLRTEKQIEAWKRGYLRRYAKKSDAINSMLEEFQAAGIKTRKNVLRMMQQTYGIENKAAVNSFEEKMFHIIRAFHVAGRCTDCGECSRVCPQNIPLHLLNRKFIKDINEFYGEYQAGAEVGSRAPLVDYTTEDVEPGDVFDRRGENA